MAKTRNAIGRRCSKFILTAEGTLIVATSDLFLFVSHVAENRASAMEIVDELERRGTRCWIAPRDVRPGEPFDDEIAEAIETSRAMLLIFSDLCNDSQYIRREVTVAGESHKPVIPFRIEDVQPRKGLRVRLSDLHWIDGFTSRERAIDELVKKFPPSTGGSSTDAPIAPPMRDDCVLPAIPPKPADTGVPEPQTLTGVVETIVDKEIKTQVAPDPVSSQSIDGENGTATAARDPDGHGAASLTDTALPPTIPRKEETPKVKEEAQPRTTAPVLSNRTSLLVVCALLLLQGIGRAGYWMDWYYNVHYHQFDDAAVQDSLFFIGWAAGAVIIAFAIARQRRWGRVLGLIGAGLGVLVDSISYGQFASWNKFGMATGTAIPLILSVVIDLVVIIYLIRFYRPVPRAA
jgi:hypothetical protein